MFLLKKIVTVVVNIIATKIERKQNASVHIWCRWKMRLGISCFVKCKQI